MALKKWAMAVLICLLIISGLGFVKFTQIKAAIAFGESFPEPSETVHSISTDVTQWQPSMQLVAELVAPRIVTLRNELEGIIAEVHFRPGQAVEQNQLLLQLDISNETAQLDAVLAQINLAELDVNRATRLLDAKASSRENLDRANAELDVARANARAIRATIAKKSIRAPFSGVAGIERYERGQYLAANSPITTLLGLTDVIWVDFALPQTAMNLTPGTQVQVKTLNDTQYNKTAKVIAIDSTVSSDSRSLKIRAVLDNPEYRYKPGQIVSVKVPSGESVTAIPVPVEAVRYDQFGSYVYRLVADQNGQLRAQRAEVDVLFRDELRAMLANTLPVGTRIATVGSYKLKSDILVNVDGMMADE
ncbi:MAG: efflux RND transporter periplasmic adaptor subunit [Aestuariibacter sp.]